MATSVILHPEGQIHIEELPNGLRRLLVKCTDAARFVPIESVVTRYPRELIELTAQVTALPWVCDAIARDEDPAYIRADIHLNLFGYLDEAAFAGRRLLDFGCGSGASTIAMGEMLPRTEVVGIELDEKLLALGSARARYRALSNVSFQASPDGTRLPENVGRFDFAMMSAVYEHLLPHERQTVLPRVWEALNPGGVLFLNQTPHRWYPIETHSTGLPLINYLPDRLAFAVARRFASNTRGHTEQQLRRGGIRGGTEREILGILAKTGHPPRLLTPQRPGCRDRIDLWYGQLNRDRRRLLKASMRQVLKWTLRLTGTVLTQNLMLAIRKGEAPAR
jgi:2-polyprenyl-3-methyl-5-hydroxy-6-metoxy-1,4-benzoquinol methylase